MNSQKFDDLSFKLLAATVLAGVFAAFMAPSAPSATASIAVHPAITSQPATIAQPVIAPATSTPVAVAVVSDPAPAISPVDVPTAVKHHGHRHALAKS